MRKIDLYSLAWKGYSKAEVMSSFKDGSDIYFAFKHELFKTEYFLEYSDHRPVVRFLDGKVLRVEQCRYSDIPFENLFYKGSVVYRCFSSFDSTVPPYRSNASIMSPDDYNRLSSYRKDVTDRYELATITDVFHPVLTAAEKRLVYDEMTKAARRDKFDSLHAYVLAYKAEQKAADLRRKKRQQDAIRRGDDRFHEVMKSYRLYANLDGFTVVPKAEDNGIYIGEHNERYSNSCPFAKHVYSYELHIKKGWHFVGVGGLLTLYRGKFNRLGMPCTWFEQKGWNYTQVRGYLVRGEHIIAKSLNEAIAINQEHRRTMLRDAMYKLQQTREIRLRAQREKEEYAKEVAARKTNAEAYMNNVITFEDSLASGNCRPGTQQFKDNVENALGKEVEQLTVRDIIPLAIRFHQETYVQRIFNHKGWKVEVNDYR